VDLGEFLVHKECTHAPATRALELRQLILMEDVSHSPTPKPQSPIPNLIPPRRRLACGPLTSGIKSRHYMRLARFRNSSDSVDIAPGLGVVEGDGLRDVSAALDVLPAYRYPLPAGDPLIANFSAISDRIRALLPAAPAVPLADVTLLSPVANPGKIVAAPVNYEKHLDEVSGDGGLHHQNQ